MSHADGFADALVWTSDILGAAVVDRENAVLGVIREIVINPSNGKIACLVVTFGGFLGLGEKPFVIPFRAFRWNAAGKECILDIPRGKLTDAPGFDPMCRSALSNEEWNHSVYGYHQLSPYWEEERSANPRG